MNERSTFARRVRAATPYDRRRDIRDDIGARPDSPGLPERRAQLHPRNHGARTAASTIRPASPPSTSTALWVTSRLPVTGPIGSGATLPG